MFIMNPIFIEREFNSIDSNLVNGLFYYVRAAVSEVVGAEILVAYGLMKTGINQMQKGRQKIGTLLFASGIAVSVHVIYSCANAIKNRKDEL